MAKKKEPNFEPSDSDILESVEALDAPVFTHVSFDYVQRGDKFHVVTIRYNPLTMESKVDSIEDTGRPFNAMMMQIKSLMAQESLRRKRSK